MKGALRLLQTALLLALAGCAPHVIRVPAGRPGAEQPPPTRPPCRVPATLRPYCVRGKTYYPLPSAEGFQETGLASWYGKDFDGKKTSNGETYDMYGGTAAHKTLPMNTTVLVHNMENGRETVVRINDRGPFVKGRIIDLTHTAAEKLGMLEKGTARVRITALGEAVTVARGGERFEQFLPHQDFNKGDFYVQIGSFLERANAERLKDKMVGWGRPAVVREYQQEGKKFYRVQVHAGSDLDGARRMERIMEKAGFPDAFVIAH
ncbi:MAG: septal ring lytic transglycosylase RlpA family protein [Desulfobacteraceae bacterium]|nr:septal ring lytic transglycosylase RlpA family protein [Desulfobacteraceae bacterium]